MSSHDISKRNEAIPEAELDRQQMFVCNQASSSSHNFVWQESQVEGNTKYEHFMTVTVVLVDGIAPVFIAVHVLYESYSESSLWR